MAELADPEQGFADFTAQLNADGGAELAAAWRRALSGCDGGPETETTTS